MTSAPSLNVGGQYGYHAGAVGSGGSALVADEALAWAESVVGQRIGRVLIHFPAVVCIMSPSTYGLKLIQFHRHALRERRIVQLDAFWS